MRFNLKYIYKLIKKNRHGKLIKIMKENIHEWSKDNYYRLLNIYYPPYFTIIYYIVTKLINTNLIDLDTSQYSLYPKYYSLYNIHTLERITHHTYDKTFIDYKDDNTVKYLDEHSKHYNVIFNNAYCTYEFIIFDDTENLNFIKSLLSHKHINKLYAPYIHYGNHITQTEIWHMKDEFFDAPNMKEKKDILDDMKYLFSEYVLDIFYNEPNEEDKYEYDYHGNLMFYYDDLVDLRNSFNTFNL